MEASAKNADAKTQASGGEDDLSMEEILHSIRKIIAEDGEEPKKEATPDAADDVPGSDVLELTDVVTEEPPKATAAQPIEAPTPTKAEPLQVEPAPAGDVLASIDAALAPAKPSTVQLTEEHLLSPEATHKATDAFKKLEAAAEPVLPPLQTTPSPAFKSGITVEDMVAAMLKPMMKEWLDKNLPAIVERIVEVEVRKLSKG